jgi:hypothetical protein
MPVQTGLIVKTAMTEPDFLDELIDERTARNPDFPKLVEAAERRRMPLEARGQAEDEAGCADA